MDKNHQLDSILRQTEFEGTVSWIPKDVTALDRVVPKQ